MKQPFGAKLCLLEQLCGRYVDEVSLKWKVQELLKLLTQNA